MKARTMIKNYTAVGLRLPANLVREIKIRAAVEGLNFREWMEAAARDRIAATKSMSEVLKREDL